jgi:hypothetical protein
LGAAPESGLGVESGPPRYETVSHFVGAAAFWIQPYVVGDLEPEELGNLRAPGTTVLDRVTSSMIGR